MPDNTPTENTPAENTIQRFYNPKNFTKIPPNALRELQLGAGILLKTVSIPQNGVPTIDANDIICATTGGIQVSCTPEFVDLGEDIDNCPNNVMELKDVSSWECTMSFTALNVSAEVIQLSLGAATVDGSKVTPNRYLVDSDFDDIWWIGDKSNGGCVAVCLKNALSTGGFSLQTTKDGKGQSSVTLTGHVSVLEQDVMPIEIYDIEPAA